MRWVWERDIFHLLQKGGVVKLGRVWAGEDPWREMLHMIHAVKSLRIEDGSQIRYVYSVEDFVVVVVVVKGGVGRGLDIKLK